MPGIARTFMTAAVASGLALVPAGAIATAPPPPSASAAATSGANPWLTLGAMTSTSSSTAATALRHEEGHAGFPPIVPLAIILLTIGVGIWIILADDEDEDGFELSPD
jgi:hypothetical protein